MTMRLATPADISAICEIEQIPEYREFIGNWTEEEHHATLEDRDAEYLVCEDEEAATVEGFAILQGLTSPHRSILLRRIAVRTPGRGTGRRLARYAMERAFVVHGAHRLWLDVFVTNVRARHTYRQLGFREEGTLRDSILRDGQYHSQVLMSLLEGEYFGSQQAAHSTASGNSFPPD